MHTEEVSSALLVLIEDNDKVLFVFISETLFALYLFINKTIKMSTTREDINSADELQFKTEKKIRNTINFNAEKEKREPQLQAEILKVKR